MTRTWITACATAALLACSALGSFAANLATGQGPSAAEAEAAKQEGEVVWYTGLNPDNAAQIAASASKELGFKVTVVRLTSGALYTRIQQEFAQDVPSADVLDTSDPAQVLQLKKDGVIQPFSTSVTPNYSSPDFYDKEMYWYTLRIIPLNIVYNTKLITGDNIPKTWKDLENPKYKNKLIQGAATASATGLAMAEGLAKLYGWEFYRKLKENGIQTQQSTILNTQVLSGERPIGLSSQSNVATALAEGQPIGSVFPSDGTLGVPGTVMIASKARHPNAAKVFTDWLLSAKGQQWAVQGGNASPLTYKLKYPEPYGDLSQYKIITISIGEYVNSAATVRAEFSKIFGGG